MAALLWVPVAAGCVIAVRNTSVPVERIAIGVGAAAGILASLVAAFLRWPVLRQNAAADPFDVWAVWARGVLARGVVLLLVTVAVEATKLPRDPALLAFAATVSAGIFSECLCAQTADAPGTQRSCETAAVHEEDRTGHG